MIRYVAWFLLFAASSRSAHVTRSRVILREQSAGRICTRPLLSLFFSASCLSELADLFLFLFVAMYPLPDLLRPRILFPRAFGIGPETGTPLGMYFASAITHSISIARILRVRVYFPFCSRCGNADDMFTFPHRSGALRVLYLRFQHHSPWFVRFSTPLPGWLCSFAPSSSRSQGILALLFGSSVLPPSRLLNGSCNLAHRWGSLPVLLSCQREPGARPLVSFERASPRG